MSKRYYSTTKPVEIPEPILPPVLVMAPVMWELDLEIAHEMQSHSTPCDCPPDQTYVPESLRQRVVEETHTSLVSSHPSGAHTTVILKHKYW